ncbi:spermatogenesis-associated protein 6 [Anguilla anguilla]|uniref:spermatogenesis-associated protein 6 n=1 Tax=Anguilla anguilla TaxID=7936 RepID=UPI0015B358AA|nr:spermatogenesis-associated protein 6 [Anguilla anguilla]
MGGLTPLKKKTLACKMPQKVLKCTVEVYIQAITCPGVVLPYQPDVYLSVCVMGQYQKTLCVPPVFPLLFHEKMVFEKAFSEAIDPSDIADLLELDTTSFELIQLVPPEGEILATVEENTRDFLYPGPRLTPRASGPERELLMKRSISFPGISPKIEFSTTSVIEECELKDGQPATPACHPTPVKPRSGRRTNKSPGSAAKRKPQATASNSYEHPTVASQSRSPSPYTHRRMCQLSEDNAQRLSHLQLGPYKFKKESESQPPFVVPRTLSASLNETPSSQLPSSSKRSLSASYTADSTLDPSLIGSYRPKPPRGQVQTNVKVNKGSLKVSESPGEFSANKRNGTPSGGPLTVQSTPASGKRIAQSPLLNRSSLRERFQNSPSSPGQWEEIHRRVQRLLKTHGAHRTLTFERDRATGEPGRRGPPVSCDDSPVLRDSAGIPGEASVHLGNGAFWSNRAAQYRGKPHRAVFEDSLGQIYKSLYKQASGTN